MIQAINKYEFERAFDDHGREDQFSYDGLNALFGYLENYGEETGEAVELDVIALCCDYCEYDNALEAAIAYGYTPDEDEDEDEDEIEEAATEYLNDRTMVIVFDSGIIIQQF